MKWNCIKFNECNKYNCRVVGVGSCSILAYTNGISFVTVKAKGQKPVTIKNNDTVASNKLYCENILKSLI